MPSSKQPPPPAANSAAPFITLMMSCSFKICMLSFSFLSEYSPSSRRDADGQKCSNIK